MITTCAFNGRLRLFDEVRSDIPVIVQAVYQEIIDHNIDPARRKSLFAKLVYECKITIDHLYIFRAEEIKIPYQAFIDLNGII